MSVSEWKKINSFNLNLCKELDKSRCIRKVIAVCYNETKKVICDDIKVHILSRNGKHSAIPAASVNLCAVTDGTNNLLLTITQTTPSNLLLQLFDVNKLLKRSEAQLSGTATTIQTCNIDNQLCIAIGLENGGLLLHRSSLSRSYDITGNFRRFDLCRRAITGIFFKQIDSSTVHMFVSSYAGIFCYKLSAANSFIDTKVILDHSNSSPHCSLSYSVGNIEPFYIVGRDDAVYCFTNDGRGPCYAIEGRKKCVAWFGSYLIVVLEDQKPSNLITTILLVLDVDNKMVLFRKEYSHKVHSVIVEKSKCYVVTEESKFLALSEIDVQSKVRMLADKNLYEVALRLLNDNGYADKSTLVQINMKYGDYLLSRGDNSGALEKYIKTIGVLEPFHVIRKLLDNRLNSYLGQYLKALSQTEYSTKDHLELLAICSTRSKLTEEINNICNDNDANEKLIKTGAKISHGKVNLVDFLHSMSNREKALEFFKNISEEEIFEFLLDNGHILMEHDQKATIDILKSVCRLSQIQQPERILPIFLKSDEHCSDFIESLAKENDSLNPILYTTLLKIYLRDWKKGKRTGEEVIGVLKKYGENMCLYNAFILCKEFSFFDGIIHLCETYSLHGLNRQCIIKNCEDSFFKHTRFYDDWDTNLLIKHVSESNLTSGNSKNILAKIFSAMEDKKYQSLLQVLEAISFNSNFLVSHIRELFTPEHLQKVNGFSNDQRELIADYNENLRKYKELLSNYQTKPIEFRRSVCDICQQQLKLPAIYYLCQHSFHKECIEAVSEGNNCVVCMNNILNAASVLKSKEGEETNATNDSDTHRNIFYMVSKNASNGKLSRAGAATQVELQNNLMAIKHQSVKQTAVGTNPFESDPPQSNAGNPFEDYDANLNPFDD